MQECQHDSQPTSIFLVTIAGCMFLSQMVSFKQIYIRIICSNLIPKQDRNFIKLWEKVNHANFSAMWIKKQAYYSCRQYIDVWPWGLTWQWVLCVLNLWYCTENVSTNSCSKKGQACTYVYVTSLILPPSMYYFVLWILCQRYEKPA